MERELPDLTRLELSADELPSPRVDLSSLSTADLELQCNDYFTQLDQLNPPECLLVDYESACEELVRRRITPQDLSTLA